MCFEKYYRNKFKWGLVLKVFSKEIQLCNRNLNLMDGLRTTTFLSLESFPSAIGAEGQYRLLCNITNVWLAVLNSLHKSMLEK